jgi:hypothetical protein
MADNPSPTLLSNPGPGGPGSRPFTPAAVFHAIDRDAAGHLVAVVAGGAPLVDIDSACRHDPTLLRLARHLWVRAQLDSGASLAALARITGISRDTLRGWSAPISLCGCGEIKRDVGSSGCDRCARRARTVWTRDALLRERDRFHAELGRLPTSTDWNVTRNPELAANWPPATTVRRRFETWAAFLVCEATIRGDGSRPRSTILIRWTLTASMRCTTPTRRRPAISLLKPLEGSQSPRPAGSSCRSRRRSSSVPRALVKPRAALSGSGHLGARGPLRPAAPAVLDAADRERRLCRRSSKLA